MNHQELLLLPSFEEEDIKSLYRTSLYANGVHRLLFRMNQTVDNPLIVKPRYRAVDLMHFSKGTVSALPSSSFDTLSLSEGENVRFYYREDLVRNADLTEDPFERTSKGANSLECLYVPYEERYSTGDAHLHKMGDRQDWLDYIVQFFHDMTKMNVWMEPGITHHSFLFNRDGGIEAFMTYDLLRLAPSYDEEKVRKNNLMMLWQFVDHLSGTLPNEVMNQLIEQHGSKLNRLYSFIQRSDFLLSDFDGVKRMMNLTMFSKQKKKEVGVFLDTANILIGTGNLVFDFHHFLKILYGDAEQYHVKDKYATVFYPEYEEQERTDKVAKRITALKGLLEEQGFHVLKASNDKEKAKEIIDGEEMDADDLALMDKIRERKNKYEEVLLLTGDGHFLPIVEELNEEGIKVKIASVSEADTNQAFISRYEKDHKFLVDYGGCFTLY
ncbi:NYN domain-containing protein [Halobacillus litoralis]|uniref:NYN domain-containing protein n=1 Tax=Halobacillus litoralis TaxID=45668 RepID=UPI001CD1FB20|nr:NYN domain-containing protein [Halobacillus litoralis]MCA0971357.1 NYN domain-containing protein [Halobacillus litoralis]